MSITIHLPVCFSETGSRATNEDSVYPRLSTLTSSDRLFLVCDGVGGENRGEVASALACESISRYFRCNSTACVTEKYIYDALEYAGRRFGMEAEVNPESAGMATTLTLLHIAENHAVLAHLGDSRIYQVRNGHIVFKTRDHKWVNELVASGVLTEEQANAHPKRNVITKVIGVGRSDQPEFTMISDIRPGDYFFLCTDGVLEQVYDELLEYHLRESPASEADMSAVMDAIRSECISRTSDNFSAYLICIKSVD